MSIALDTTAVSGQGQTHQPHSDKGKKHSFAATSFFMTKMTP
jgi:hypothetical protein